MTFAEMLRAVRRDTDRTLSEMARPLEVSPQYFHDLERGRRTPSVAFVDRLCAYLGRGPLGRLEWHRAAAEAHGWQVRAAILEAGAKPDV